MPCMIKKLYMGIQIDNLHTGCVQIFERLCFQHESSVAYIQGNCIKASCTQLYRTGLRQEKDVTFERDASGQLKELGAGAFGRVRSLRSKSLEYLLACLSQCGVGRSSQNGVFLLALRYTTLGCCATGIIDFSSLYTKSFWSSCLCRLHWCWLLRVQVMQLV